MRILKLRPTQFAVGMQVVNQKEKSIRKMSETALEEMLLTQPVPVVEGPGGELFIVDRHHLARALWQAGEKSVYVEVIWKWKESDGHFWKLMEHQGFVYLYDQFGTGPHSPLELPPDVRSLADDPYRTLAKLVRNEGGFTKVKGKKIKKPFQEFTWANFFRSRIPLQDLLSDPESALKTAMELAASEEAKELPGYISPNICKDVNSAAAE